MKVNVHRAASVFTPRSVVIINPPSPARMQELVDAGGAPRALEWVLDGMRTQTMTVGSPSAETLRRQLSAQGLNADTIERMIAVAGLDQGLGGGEERIAFDSQILELAEEQALTIALAMSGSRVTLEGLVSRTKAPSLSATRYRERYPIALQNAGLERVELIERFPVLSGHFGYTRGSSDPGSSRLAAYRERRGNYVVYGDITETEALFIGLVPSQVATWLQQRGFQVGAFEDERAARIAILRASGGGANGAGVQPVLEAVTELVHSYAHRLIRIAAVHAGIERNSLSELLVPAHLGVFIYAAARGDFILGGLQAVFEGDLDRLLHDFVDGEHRCALDPGCSRGGGACLACLHLGEPSCRLFNRKLDRTTLIGPNGYLKVGRE